MESGGDMEPIMVEMAVSSPGQKNEVPAGTAPRGDDEAAPPTAEPSAAASTRPYYECVFCKRGFTTAQALGGHMNIHRRHRHRANQPPAFRRDTPTATGITSAVSRDVECYNQHRYLAYPPPPALPATSPPMTSGFATYYTGSTATVAGMDGEAMRPAGSPSLTIRELSLFGAADTRDHHDLHLRLGCGGDGSPRTPEGSPEWLSSELPERRLELDLELRLGRHPRH